jgi:predicted RNase H-like nuclease (RuvC/YqgF family)
MQSAEYMSDYSDDNKADKVAKVDNIDNADKADKVDKDDENQQIVKELTAIIMSAAVSADETIKETCAKFENDNLALKSKCAELEKDNVALKAHIKVLEKTMEQLESIMSLNIDLLKERIKNLEKLGDDSNDIRFTSLGIPLLFPHTP